MLFIIKKTFDIKLEIFFFSNFFSVQGLFSSPNFKKCLFFSPPSGGGKMARIYTPAQTLKCSGFGDLLHLIVEKPIFICTFSLLANWATNVNNS